MLYISTNHKAEPVHLDKAILASHADDSGLYWPEQLPVIPRAFFNNFSQMSFDEIAYVVANTLFSDSVSSAELKQIVEGSFNFPVPVVHVGDNIYAVELFHGPTLAFKDFGARFMARMLCSLRSDIIRHGHKPRRLKVVVATTGNTGSAIANGFRGIEGVDVYILFPRGTAGRQLEAQFTTIGGNIHALEVQGSIDDCQALAAQAYTDKELNSKIALTSANSVNIVRLLPQTFYYFYAMAKMQNLVGADTPVTVAIPGGNMGNLTAALTARAMGLEIPDIVAAENSNNFVTRMMRDGVEGIPPRVQPTLAYAADKSRPTNLPRLRELCTDISGMRRAFRIMSFDDADIIKGVNDCYDRYGYVVDPHTVLAYNALSKSLPANGAGLMLATAHPAKSLTAMSAITGRAIDLPLQLTRFMTGRDQRRKIGPTYDALRKILLENV